MKYPVFSAKSRAHVQRVISGLDLAKKWSVEITRKTKGRSLSQNALYWRWQGELVKLLVDYTGHDKDWFHEFFMKKFLEPKRTEIFGEMVERYTTTGLTVREMCEYMDQIDRFCISELGISLPVPAEMQLRG